MLKTIRAQLFFSKTFWAGIQDQELHPEHRRRVATTKGAKNAKGRDVIRKSGKDRKTGWETAQNNDF